MFTLRNAAALVFAVVSIGSVACSYRDSRPMSGPDGRQWLAVTCSHGEDNCWQEAAERCPRGYVTADKAGGITEGAFATNGTLVTFPQQRGQMLIQCREPQVASMTPVPPPPPAPPALATP